MDFGGILSSLKLDVWYKALVYIGGVALLLSLFIDVKGITNTQLQLIASGLFLVGLGEWKNTKTKTRIKPPNVYTGPALLMQSNVWKPDLIGLLFDVAGLVLLGVGVWSIVGDVRAPTPPPTQTLLPTPTLTP